MHAHACVHVYTHVLEGGGDKDTSIFTAVQPESSMAMDASKESWDKEPIKYLWTSVRLPGEPQKYLEYF